MATGERSGQVPFLAHIELLQSFLARRAQIVEKLQLVLNAQHQPVQYQEDRPLLSRQFEDCFFTAPVSREQAGLRGQLQDAHWAHGFRPRDMPGIPNEMFDPADMMARAFRLWRHTRWPGRNGRLHYAHTLFNLYVVRCLALLDMRLWDDGPEYAAERLAQNQRVLDALWQSSPPRQPVLVRDVRWLVPVAQSPTTDELAPYFRVAELVAGSLSEADRLQIHKASVLMAGGHLRSQLRHFNMQGTPLDDPALLLSTRRSNALDCAMTIQGLVPLLRAYEQAVQNADSQRLELGGAICQAISPDPELFVNHLDLLGAYSMIEHLFVAVDHAGTAALTPMGGRHVQLVREYAGLMPRLAPFLHEDCPRFRPVRGAYSPYGVMYGFSSNLMEHMAIKTLQPDAETRFSLEDVFAEGAAGADRLAWVSGWRRLPHMTQQVQQLYEYPQQFAEQIFERIVQALRRRMDGGEAQAAARTGRLYIAATGDGTPDLPVEYILSSDAQVVAANQARHCEAARLLRDRHEGEFIVSYQTPGGWTAITKDILTEVLGAGRDTRINNLPGTAAAVLRVMGAGVCA
jgi:hypothetical protein